MKKTALNEIHRNLGARMVDFGGWEMPVHYGSQINEHHVVRRQAGMFDVSHMCTVDVLGDGSRDFLARLMANSMDKLNIAGKALYTCMLNESGGIIDDLIVYFFSEDRFRLVINAGTADKDLAWINRHRIDQAPTLAIRPRTDLSMIAVQGPQARELVFHALPGCRGASEHLKPFFAASAHLGDTLGEIQIARTGYTGEDGFEITVANEHAPRLWKALHTAGVVPCGLGSRDTLRLEAGLNLYGQDMDEKVTPLESGLEWTVDLSDAHVFIGKEALLSLPPVRQLTGLLLEESGGILRAHQPVFDPSNPAFACGEITSGGFSPTLERSIAFARLPRTLHIGDKVEVEIRNKRLPARIVKHAFVRQGQSLL